MQQLMTSLDGFFQAVTGSGSPIAILGQHLPHLIQTINNIDLSKGANALEELASCVCPKLDAIAQTISAGDNALHTATENGSQAIADAIDNLRKQEWETQGYFAQLANQGLIDPDVLSVTPQSAAADHPMAFKASAAAMARKASTVNPNLIDMSPEEIVASGTHVKVTKFDNWTDWAISTVESLIGALFKDFLKGFDLVTNTANTLAGDLGRKIEPILKDLFQGDYSAWEFIPRAILNTLESVIEAHGEVNPDNVEDVGLSILGFAFIVGQIMHFGAELGGKLFYPASSVWAHNAEMAIEILGYHEILRSFHGPLFRTAITTSAQYRYNSKFRPNVPSESMGFQALARGHIDEAKLTKLVELNGVHKDWVQPLLDIAYRPISAFIIERLATAGTFTDQEMRDILVDNGIRPKLLPPLEGAFKFLTVQPQQSKYFEAAMNAAKEGAISMAELSQALNDPGLNKQQIHYNTQLVLMQQRMNTATEAERQAEALLGDGAWTPQQAQLFMENAGVQPWRIANIVNLGSAKAQAKAALKAESEDRRLARKAYSEAQRAIEAQFLDGNLSENGTTAALQSALVAFVAEMHQLGQDAAAGEAQLVAGELENAALMELLKARKQGHQVMIYGKLMDRKAGDLLRQRIDTVKEAVIREDMDHANALQNLLNLGIDKAEAATLADHWALQVGKKGSQPLGPNQPKY